jgi:hypothetical protein
MLCLGRNPGSTGFKGFDNIREQSDECQSFCAQVPLALSKIYEAAKRLRRYASGLVELTCSSAGEDTFPIVHVHA